MLKKTGIVVATVATGLIGLSPLAFADDWDNFRGADKVEISEDNDTKTYEDNSIERNQSNHCLFIQDQDASIEQEGLLELPVDAPIVDEEPVDGADLGDDQTQEGNCTNAGDTSGLLPPVPPVLP